jgi:hypothetical protein
MIWRDVCLIPQRTVLILTLITCHIRSICVDLLKPGPDSFRAATSPDSGASLAC